MSNTITGNALWVVFLPLALACDKPPRVEDQPQPTATATSSPVATSEPTAEALPDTTSAPTAEPTAKPTADAPKARPPSIYGPSKKISSTFGSTPGSRLKLKTKDGDFTLELGEGTLRTGTNITFEVGGKTIRGKLPVIGDIVHLATQLGDSTRFSEISTGGPPFTVIVPSKKSVNLAVGTIELDEAGQEGSKVKDWSVYAPVRFDGGAGVAVFELTKIGPCVMHATSAEPTVKAAVSEGDGARR
jgi:hypothetical protein